MANTAISTDHQGPTVAAGFVTGMLAGLRRLGRDPVPLLTAAGIDGRIADGSNGRIPLAHYAALYAQINHALDDEAFGLFSQPMRPGSFELLCRAVAGAGTLGESLERCGRFLRILLPDLTVEMKRAPSMATLTIAEVAPLATAADDAGRVFAFEWLLRLIHALACWLAGRSLALERVDFPYPRPPHADDYALIYTADARFDAASLVARFDATLLDLPVQRDEEAVRIFLQGAPAKITTLYRRDRDAVPRVREYLRATLPMNPGLAEVAAALSLSPRTLHRRLAEEGANYRTVKDALRRDLALARLAKEQTPLAQIAADLGYADTSTFFRAFISWTGQAPSAYRHLQRGIA